MMIHPPPPPFHIPSKSKCKAKRHEESQKPRKTPDFYEIFIYLKI
jgi:hypothetical protein